MKFKKLKIKSIALLVAMLMVFNACGVGDPASIIGDGADKFADGREEKDPGLVSSDKILDTMMEDFSGSFGNPEANQIDDSQADQIINDTDEDDVIDQSNDTTSIVASDDDLKAIMHQMLDDTKTVATFNCDSSYSFDANTITNLYDTLIFEDAYDAHSVKSFSWTPVGTKRTLTFEYDLPVDELKKMKSETRTLVGEAIKELENQINVKNASEYDLVCAVNEYLCDLITYPPLDVNKYPPVGAKPIWHTGYNAFKEGIAVCDGYSRAAKLMLNELGVECGIEVGNCTGGGHAWNLVKVDGSWYQMDVTWNDGSGDIDKSARKTYLLVTDDYMKQSRAWNTALYPATPSKAYK